MAIEWIYDNGYVGLGVEWATEVAPTAFAFSADIYRWDSQNTDDSATFREWLRYEPDGSEGEWDSGFGSGSGSRVVDSFGRRVYDRKDADYGITIALRTSSNFGTWYGGRFHTVGTVEASSTVTVPHLAQAVTDVSASRETDNRAALSWDLPLGAVDGVKVEVSIDGCAWTSADTLAGSATSYAYTKASADHSYRFRVATIYRGSQSAWAESGAVVMAPAAPRSVSLERTTGTDVLATIKNGSAVATAIEWQASLDNGVTWSPSTRVESLSSFTATGLVGVAVIRVRNVNGSGSSPWLVSSPIVMICPPNPPTITSPRVGEVVSTDQEGLRVTWLHNAIDGSPQSAWELSATVDGETMTASGTTEAAYGFREMPAAGSQVSVKVRTKGADPSFSEWSTATTFAVYAPPTVVVSAPAELVSAMPIALAAAYTDMPGFRCVSATASLRRDGRVLFSEPADIDGASIGASLDASEFLPENGQVYEARLDIRSSSGLAASASSTFAVEWDEPAAPRLDVRNDPETGYATVTASYDNDDLPEGTAPAVGVSVARVNPDGSLTQLISMGQSGAGAVDRYAPLNTPYSYAVTTHGAVGNSSTAYVPNVLESDRSFAYWTSGGVDKIAWGEWNPSEGGISVTRPDKTREFYAGRPDPVSYDGAAMLRSESPGFGFFTSSEAARFEELMEDGGRGVYKSVLGHVFRADFDDLRIIPDMEENGWWGEASIRVTRIAGGVI